jgi:hypothetical protein
VTFLIAFSLIIPFKTRGFFLKNAGFTLLPSTTASFIYAIKRGSGQGGAYLPPGATFPQGDAKQQGITFPLALRHLLVTLLSLRVSISIVQHHFCEKIVFHVQKIGIALYRVRVQLFDKINKTVKWNTGS